MDRESRIDFLNGSFYCAAQVGCSYQQMLASLLYRAAVTLEVYNVFLLELLNPVKVLAFSKYVGKRYRRKMAE
jgi:hypothetical protein